MPQLDPINIFTRRLINTNPQLYDNYFNHDPLTAMLKGTLKEDFGGGSLIQDQIITGNQPGGSYLKGKKFNTTQRQLEQPLQFNMKYFEAAITLFSEDIKVLNVGPNAAVSLMKERIANAFMSINAFLAVASYMNGQQAGYTPIVNGFAEALNDGTTPAWDNQTYSTYGDLSRTTFGANINSTPLNLAGQSISYPVLNNYYWANCTQGAGEWEPNLVVTTPKGYALLQSQFQTQQRFQEVTLDIGFTGMKFNGSTILASRYMPGSDIGTPGTRSNRLAEDYLTETIGAPTDYPTAGITTNGTIGETLLMLNARPKKINLYISTNSMYGVDGFREFVPEGNSTVITALGLLAANMTVPTPYLHGWINNFTG